MSVGCWAVCGWGGDSASPPSSETKLETSLSNVSQFALLASIQSSKVLKWTLPVLRVMSGVLKGVKFLLTFVPDLPRVLKWLCLPLFLTQISILDMYPGSWKESTFVSVALCCLVYCQLGSWNDSPRCTFHHWLVSRWSDGSWKESQILQLSPLVAVLVVRDLKRLSFPRYMYVRVLKWGLERNSFCVLYARFDTKVLNEGLERSQICVLSVYLNRWSARICCPAIYKEPYHRYLLF